MNRETESHFSNLPSISIKRSSFKRPHDHKTSFNSSDIIPIYVDSDILPGDTVKMDMASLIRMQTPIFPVMDNAYADIYFFFVPHRLIWTHWREFWGENRLTAWEQQTEYEIPQIEAPENGWNVGSLMDYMGIPTGVDDISVSHLPVRAYLQIWNDWFRDENLKDPAMITLDETTVTGTNKGASYDYTTGAETGAAPLKAAKFHDYFTSALKAPQKGPTTNIPLSGLVNITMNTPAIDPPTGITWDSAMDSKNVVMHKGSTAGSMVLEGWDAENGYTGSIGTNKGTMMYADLSTAGETISINAIRQAFAIQAFYEAQARGGSRYIEFIKNIFGVTSPDGRQQRAEYLGGTRIQINMDQVLQTGATTETSPQGNTAAFSCTTSADSIFTHSFTEHGTLMGLVVIRTDHTYQQGIERMWSRKKWTDFYIPQFANLGEMPIYNKEIYAGTADDEGAFGYQESWADYRYKPNRISGEMRSSYTQSLDAWHYGDDYEELPTLSSEWIDETEANIDRTIAVQHSNANQFFGDFYFDATYVRPMPIYSIPAMLNHF